MHFQACCYWWSDYSALSNCTLSVCNEMAECFCHLNHGSIHLTAFSKLFPTSFLFPSPEPKHLVEADIRMWLFICMIIQFLRWVIELCVFTQYIRFNKHYHDQSLPVPKGSLPLLSLILLPLQNSWMMLSGMATCREGHVSLTSTGWWTQLTTEYSGSRQQGAVKKNHLLVFGELAFSLPGLAIPLLSKGTGFACFLLHLEMSDQAVFSDLSLCQAKGEEAEEDIELRTCAHWASESIWKAGYRATQSDRSLEVCCGVLPS